MNFIEATRAITKAYTKLRGCENMQDLKKLNLTLSDYNAAKDLFGELSTPGTGTATIIKAVAEFYKNCGFDVSYQGIAYQINTKGGTL